MTNPFARRTRPRIAALTVAFIALVASVASSAALFVSVAIAPPLLPVYEQPLIPGPGYIWTPGYWASGPDGFYWVPGTWVLAPYIGALWTPGYWGWREGLYFWHPGYWGRHVGFYGGINYGFGYPGVGYFGGRWSGGAFAYNRAVNNVNVVSIRNTYSTTVVNNVAVRRVSYNGGGGVAAQPMPQERVADAERHRPLLPVQARHELAASSNRALLASVNDGRPALAATPRPARYAAAPASAPVRSFSQQALAALAQPRVAQARTDAAGQNPRIEREQRIERRNPLANGGPVQNPRNPEGSRANGSDHPQPELRHPGRPHREGDAQSPRGGGERRDGR